MQIGCKKDEKIEPDSPLTDSRDGKVYEVVQIENQIWMAENLNYQMDNSWCYGDSSIKCIDYGRLYSWSAAMSACPSGWHLPSDKEWKDLEMNLGMSLEQADAIDQRGTDEGTQLKDNGIAGFDALFGGIRDENGAYSLFGTGSAFWTSSSYDGSNAWYRGLSNVEPRIHRYYYDKDMAFSVRCVKNQVPTLITNLPLTIGTKSAVLSASLVYDGGTAISEKGFCWSIDRSPTITDNFIINAVQMTEDNDFSSLIDGLQINTTYFIRAYAKNEYGIGYGNEIKFTTNATSAPVVKTAPVTGIGISSAQSGGEIIDNGERDITGKGVCWNDRPDPTILNDHTTNGTGSETFSSQITGLKPNSVYYVRAYATNNMGISYGENRTFTSLPLNPIDSMTDSRNGNVYKTVNIGGRWWMAENLNYEMADSWCYEDNDANCSEYGRLYSWSAANTACPSGWHLPSDTEWKNLEINLGMSLEQADAIDQRGTDEGTQLKVNGSSGFDVLFGGIRNEDGSYSFNGSGGAFWTSSSYNVSQAWYRGFNYEEPRIHRLYYDKDMAFSVRCIRD